MKTLALPVLLLFASTVCLRVAGQGTAFTYQGRLNNDGAPANGSYDIQFTLYATNMTGSPVAGPVTNSATSVSNGLFTATVDFGPGAFTGQPVWLDISVSPAGSNTFAELTPRQPITATPYAVLAGGASNLLGTLPVAALPSVVVTNGETGVNVSGTFTGNGGGLTNLNASQLASGTIPDSLLASNVLMSSFEVTNYTVNGIYTIVVPPGANQMVAKLWGAGGGGSAFGATGAGGAFVQTTLSVVPGQTLTVVVGQHGDFDDNNGGGNGSGDAPGGNINDPDGGQGGQASSLFYFSSGLYITEAVAGGGGGAGEVLGGAGGNPGQTGEDGGGVGGDNGSGGSGVFGMPVGSNYAANATVTGIASLSSAEGNGGVGGEAGGGGGGGYGGGGGGVFAGGGGGGSYGQVIIGGNDQTPGNTNDPGYVFPGGLGGGGLANGQDGLAVITFFDEINAAQLTGTLPTATLPPVVVTDGETGVNLSGTFAGNGGGLTNLNATQLTGTLPATTLPSVVVTNGETGVNLSGTFNFGAITVTNFSQVVGPLPASFVFTSHGGRLLITPIGAGWTSSSGTIIGMIVQLDGTAILTNQVYASASAFHMPFEARTVVINNAAAGSHTLKLTALSGTTTDLNDSFSATVQELPY